MSAAYQKLGEAFTITRFIFNLDLTAYHRYIAMIFKLGPNNISPLHCNDVLF